MSALMLSLGKCWQYLLCRQLYLSVYQYRQCQLIYRQVNRISSSRNERVEFFCILLLSVVGPVPLLQWLTIRSCYVLTCLECEISFGVSHSELGFDRCIHLSYDPCLCEIGRDISLLCITYELPHVSHGCLSSLLPGVLPHKQYPRSYI